MKIELDIDSKQANLLVSLIKGTKLNSQELRELIPIEQQLTYKCKRKKINKQ